MLACGDLSPVECVCMMHSPASHPGLTRHTCNPEPGSNLASENHHTAFPSREALPILEKAFFFLT